MSKHHRTDLDFARDDLMSHIHRCGVLKATPEQQVEWMDDTIAYLSEVYPALSPEQMGELRTIGLRFCQPVIPHGKGNTALTVQDEAEVPVQDEAESNEMAGV